MRIDISSWIGCTGLNGSPVKGWGWGSSTRSQRICHHRWWWWWSWVFVDFLSFGARDSSRASGEEMEAHKASQFAEAVASLLVVQQWKLQMPTSARQGGEGGDRKPRLSTPPSRPIAPIVPNLNPHLVKTGLGISLSISRVTTPRSYTYRSVVTLSCCQRALAPCSPMPLAWLPMMALRGLTRNRRHMHSLPCLGGHSMTLCYHALSCCCVGVLYPLPPLALSELDYSNPMAHARVLDFLIPCQTITKTMKCLLKIATQPSFDAYLASITFAHMHLNVLSKVQSGKQSI